MVEDAGARRLLDRVWGELARDASELDGLPALPTAPLPARLDVSALAVGGVAALAAAAARAAGRGAADVRLDGDRIAAAFGSDRSFALDGRTPAAFAPLSGFWRTADGWVRTHGNYPWHAAVLRAEAGLGADAGGEAFADAVATMPGAALAERVTAAGGLCVLVAREDPADTAARAARPLVERRRLDGAGRPRRTQRSATPLAGVRVLDLTRVIAGPVATRALAQLGAEVLRLDPPARPEIEAQHLDTGAGKRSALLDLADRAGRERFLELLDTADVVVLGYRPAALERLGLSPNELAARRPGLVVAQLSAWGFDGDDAERRGFDSIVQAACGIAWVEADADAGGARPGALPVQALDHASGYLLAAAVLSELDAEANGPSLVRASLRRTASELLAGSRRPERTGAVLGEEARLAQCETRDTPLGRVRIVRPAVTVAGVAADWPAAPRPWGRDPAAWA